MSKKKWYRIYIEWRKARKSGLDLRAFYMPIKRQITDKGVGFQ